MSQNSSKAEKSDTHNRKSGRSGSFGNQRAYTGGGGGGKGGGGNAVPHPQSASINSSSSSANRSYRRATNGQGGQSRGNNLELNVAAVAAAGARPGQNGSHFQPLSGGVSEGSGAGKPANVPIPRSNRPVPKVPPPPQSTPDSMPPTTPAKGDGPKGSGFTFQFGTLSPGFVNGMQIPARTSSAPPNLDEQKRDQARHDSFRAVPTKPIPSAPKQQQPLVKEAVNGSQPNSGEAHATSHVKRDHHPQGPTAPATTITQKPPVLPLTGMSMPMPFPSQVPVPFGGPNSQMQSQGVAATSMQMPMPLSAGSTAQMQQQVYVPSLQSHPLQTAGMVPQGQGLNFPPPQMGHQLPPMSNMGIGIASPFAQQQAGKFGATRKAVKITHPETHEELRLDGSSSGARSHPNVPPQSQAIPSFSPAHQINYYNPSYNHPPFFLPPQTTVPIASAQMTNGPQASRYSYPGGQGSPSVTFKNPSLNPVPISKTGLPPMHGSTELLKLDHHHDAQPIGGSASSAPTQVTVKPVVSHGEKVGSSSVAVNSPPSKGELPKSLKPNKDVNVSSEEAASVATNPEGRRKETGRRSDSFKDHQKMPGRKDTRQSQSQQQEDVSDHTVSSNSSASVMMPRDVAKHHEMQSPPSEALESSMLASSLHSQSSENDSSKDGDSVECKVTNASLGASRGVLGSAGDPLPDTCASPEVSEVASTVVRVDDDSSVPSNKYVPESEGTVTDNLDGSSHVNIDIPGGQLVQKLIVEQGKTGLNEGVTQDSKIFEMPTSAEGSVTSLDSNMKETSVIGSVEQELEKNERPVDSQGSEADRTDDDSTRSPATSSDSVNAETTTSSFGSSANSHENKTGTMDASTNRSEQTDKEDVFEMTTGSPHQESSPGSSTLSDDAASKQELKVAEVGSSGQVTPSVSGSKDKPAETNRAKITIGKGKKKRKDILKAADAAGSTADLYVAYKGPEEKQETAVSSGNIDNSPSVGVKQEPVADAGKDVVAADEDGQLDDWEDAADISTPKLKPSGNGKQSRVDEEGTMGKKYTRDFLLTLSEQCTELPANFEIGSDTADALMSDQVGMSQHVEPYPNSGRVIDRSVGGPRPDRRGSGIVDDDKWSKSPGPFTPGRDPRFEIHGGPVPGFRPGQGGNHGVLRNPRGQPTGQYVSGILSGPMQSLAQGGMHRGNSDADRWQRATGFQKGLIPYPQTPLQVMHKAERKYEVGKVSDEEAAKQRQLKAILNKLTPQNFEKLFEKVKEVNIDNAVALTGVISQIFDKALMEPTFCEMYADFCFHLASDLPDFFEDNERINFKRLLLNKCQEEFERGEREQAEADRAEEDGEIKCSDEEREEKRVQARRRMLGNIRLIGELYKKKMLTERIMHECINKLLGQPHNPDEEDVEALCKLMSTIGEMIDHPRAKEHMDFYFDKMMKLSNNMKLSSRVRFMLKDSIDLRKNKWQQRRKVEGPKKIEEVHRDAAQERQAQASRLARGPSISSSRRGQPADFGPRGSSMMPSQNTQMGGLRGFPPQNRGFGGQDVRYEERHPYESRVLSVPLSQRPIDDDSITLGPQGGLARGMSVRGEPLIPGVPMVDMSRTPVDSRRIGTGPNGYNPSGEWTPYNAREDALHRYSSERSMPVPSYNQVNSQDRHAHPGNRDMRNAERPFDRPMASSVTHVQASSNASLALHAGVSEKVVSDERLRDKSIAAIKEFYSAKDKEEVALCMKDLNSPGFHPTMVSLWVTDSFERKDIERELLARLLVDLTKARDDLLNQVQLMKGFELVLAGLEDAVNDAPKAAEFLGRIFAKVILENIVPLGDIGRLIHRGGEEPGRLLEVGLASEVLGSILEIIRSEKGESVLKEIRVSSNLRLEDFRPPDPIKSRKLEAFI